MFLYHIFHILIIFYEIISEYSNFSVPKIPDIPHHEELLDIFPSEICDEINWASPADTFHLFVKVLKFPVYTHNLLLGFVVSVGGLTESLVSIYIFLLLNLLCLICLIGCFIYFLLSDGLDI